MRKNLNEKEYQEIKRILLASNVSTENQVELKIQGMLGTAKKYTIVSFILALILAVLLPRFIVFTVMIFCLYIAWLWSSTLSSKSYFTRYLKEIEQEQESSFNN